jgi:hypothetical protein
MDGCLLDGYPSIGNAGQRQRLHCVTIILAQPWVRSIKRCSGRGSTTTAKGPKDTRCCSDKLPEPKDARAEFLSFLERIFLSRYFVIAASGYTSQTLETICSVAAYAH